MINAGRIVFILLIAIFLTGLYWSWSSRVPPDATTASQRDLDKVKGLSAHLAEELQRDTGNAWQRHALERAGADWRRSLFERPPSGAPHQAAKAPSPLDAYTYSGYMEVDKKRLAIISGMQYQVGDRLEYGKYVVRSIEPTKVVVEDIGKREQVTLPFVGGGF